MIEAAAALELIKNRLSPHRYQHSLNVAVVARDLAQRHRVDSEKAYLAGVLHDYAKNLSEQELLAIAENNPGIADEMEKQIPEVLHAPVGAFLLQQELGIADEEILQAVKFHTLGSTKMTPLDKVIFMADMIEPGRAEYPQLERLRTAAREDLDEAMLLGLESTILYCLEQQRLLHPRTVEARNYFLPQPGKYLTREMI